MGFFGPNFGPNWDRKYGPLTINSPTVGKRGKAKIFPRQRYEVLQIQKVQVPFKMIGIPVRPITTKISLVGAVVSPLRAKLNLRGAALRNVKANFAMKGAALRDVKAGIYLTGKKNYSDIKALLKAALLIVDEE